VSDLLGLKATTAHQALEDQSTTVLAWLIDRSPAIARAVIELFLGDVGDLDYAIGAETQVSLPKPGGGALRPDLSICASEHALQLLVEVKVAAEFSFSPEFGGLQQDDVYRYLWRLQTAGGAKIRAVGTLTRNPRIRHRVDTGELIARDVSWRELHATLAHVLSTDGVEPDVRLVGYSFVEAIDERIAPKPPTAGELAAFHKRFNALLIDTSTHVATTLGGGTPKLTTGAGYVGRRIVLIDSGGRTLFLRLHLAAKGSRLAIPGTPDALVVGPERDANGTLEPEAWPGVEQAGFSPLKDNDGYMWRRRVWPIDDDSSSGELAEEIARAIRSTGLVRLDGADLARQSHL